VLPDAPLLLGSGLSEATATAFGDADGAIVGTAFKRDGLVDEAVAPERVAAIVQSFRGLSDR
ncbi:MAG: hypothetical protein WA208_10010, partial [Thermoanaerobaculia bacterium]